MVETSESSMEGNSNNKTSSSKSEEAANSSSAAVNSCTQLNSNTSSAAANSSQSRREYGYRGSSIYQSEESQSVDEYNRSASQGTASVASVDTSIDTRSFQGNPDVAASQLSSGTASQAFDYDAVISQVLTAFSSGSTERSPTASLKDDGRSDYFSNNVDFQGLLSAAGPPGESDSKPAAQLQDATSPVQDVPRSQNTIAVPGELDVLFGRGKSSQDHPGTKKMRRMSDLHRSIYDRADRDDKTEITRNIVKIIKAEGGRFLKFDKQTSGWVEVSDDLARKKVAHAMRDGRPKPLGRLSPDDF